MKIIEIDNLNMINKSCVNSCIGVQNNTFPNRFIRVLISVLQFDTIVLPIAVW